MIFREAVASDAEAIGRLLGEGLLSAPSSDYEADELPPDLLSAGEQLLERLQVPGSTVLLAVEGEGLVGLARVTRREFLRSRHVADLMLLVHPLARQRKVGCDLLSAAEGEAFLRGATKLAMRVAEDDVALGTLLSGHGWRCERVERGGMARAGRELDVGIWARHLEGGGGRDGFLSGALAEI